MTQAYIALANGTIYTGMAFGADGVTLMGKPIATFVGRLQIILD